MVAALVIGSPLRAAETLTFTTTAKSEGGNLGGRILAEAYRRLGIHINVKGLPGLRAIHDADSGHSAGEVVRLKFVLKKYANLRLVPEPVLYLNQVAAATNPDLKITGWRDVKKYSVVTVLGFKSIQRRVRDQDHVFTNDIAAALRVLKHGRVDILILSRMDILRAIQKNEIKGVHVLDPPLKRVPLYHLLHKNHEKMIPAVDRVLKNMRQDGTTQRLTDAYLQQFVN